MNQTWFWWGAMLLWGVGALFASSDPTDSFLAGAALILSGILLAIFWFIRFVVALHHPERRLLLVKEAIVAIAFVLLAMTPLPRNTRFFLSEPLLRAYTLRPQEAHNQLLGLYQFAEIHQIEEGWLFELGEGDLTRRGFLYHPGPAPKSDKLYHHEHLSGPWYLWTYDAF